MPGSTRQTGRKPLHSTGCRTKLKLQYCESKGEWTSLKNNSQSKHLLGWPDTVRLRKGWLREEVSLLSGLPNEMDYTEAGTKHIQRILVFYFGRHDCRLQLITVYNDTIVNLFLNIISHYNDKHILSSSTWPTLHPWRNISSREEVLYQETLPLGKEKTEVTDRHESRVWKCSRMETWNDSIISTRTTASPLV